MLAYLKEWITSIVVMVIFITIVDMIMPNNNLRKYSKFVLGLIMISVLIAPIIKVFSNSGDIEGKIINYTAQLNNKNESFSKQQIATNINEDMQIEFNENIKKVIEKRLKSEFGSSYKVTLVKTTFDKAGNNPKIKDIELKKNQNGSVVEVIKKVDIKNKISYENITEGDKKVIKLLKEEFDINPSNIKFTK